MKTSRILSLVLPACAAWPSFGAPADLIDAPGPGYRALTEAHARTLVPTTLPRFRVPTVLVPSVPGTAPLSDFSQPIHLQLAPTPGGVIVSQGTGTVTLKPPAPAAK